MWSIAAAKISAIEHINIFFQLFPLVMVESASLLIFIALFAIMQFLGTQSRELAGYAHWYSNSQEQNAQRRIYLG